MKKDTLIHAHGGDLDAIEKTYGIPRCEIIDFSGNINPLGFPKKTKANLSANLDIITTYPDKDYTSLRKSIGGYTGAQHENIVVGNGSTELISTFIKSVNPKKAIILGPAYSEYEKELEKINSNFKYFPLEEADNFSINIDKLLSLLTEEIDMFIACNPNNPTGTIITSLQMEELLIHCKSRSISVMVDETYIEFSDNIDEICSIALTTKYDNLFVIRGISKFFSAPGLRLGYGISSNKKFHTLLKSNQDPWSVNSLAAFAGEKLFDEKEFIAKTHRLISSEREKALKEFETWNNIKSYPSSSNFILLKLLTDTITSAEIFHELIQKKMLIRDASSFTFLDNSFIRFCLLLPDQNANLINSLKTLIEKDN